MSCAKFAQLYQSNPEATKVTFFAWAQGFMSGLNMAAQVNHVNMRELSEGMDDQKQQLRSYCANNPLKDFLASVIDLYGKQKIYPPNSN